MAKRPTTPTTTTPETPETSKRRKVAPAATTPPAVQAVAASNGHAQPLEPLQPIAAEPGERTETRACPCALTEAERLEYGQEQSECELQYERLKAAAAEISRTAREHAARRNKLAHIIDAGVEERPIDCVWRADYTAKEWRLLRTDTGTTVESRTMTGADLVHDLFGSEAADSSDDGPEPPPPADDDGFEPWPDDDGSTPITTVEFVPPVVAVPSGPTRLPPPPRRSDGTQPPTSTPGHDVA